MRVGVAEESGGIFYAIIEVNSVLEKKLFFFRGVGSRINTPELLYKLLIQSLDI